MGMDKKPAGESEQNVGRITGTGAHSHDLDTQRLRILRCTAQAMASSPGGLRFKPGTRPWLEGILISRPASSRLINPCSTGITRFAAN
jgi:hypothetical protein